MKELSKIFLASFRLLADFRYKRFFSVLLLLIGLSGVALGWYWLWQQTRVPLCPAISQEKLPTAFSKELVADSVSTNIIVDLSGAVNNPGLYEVSSSARLAEVVALAEGFSSEVDQLYIAENLNLASTLVDGQKIFIPFQGISQETENDNSNKNVALESTNCVSINGASKDSLMDLSGIGEVRAESIIQNRPYEVLTDLITNEVLTEKLFLQIEALICL